MITCLDQTIHQCFHCFCRPAYESEYIGCIACYHLKAMCIISYEAIKRSLMMPLRPPASQTSWSMDCLRTSIETSPRLASRTAQIRATSIRCRQFVGKRALTLSDGQQVFATPRFWQSESMCASNASSSSPSLWNLLHSSVRPPSLLLVASVAGRERFLAMLCTVKRRSDSSLYL